jgi:hypothetical protein
MYEDKTLICKECGQEFVFTAGEQEFYAEKGFENVPQRCRECRNARKNGGNQFALIAAALPEFPSSPVRTARSVAASASPK